LMSGPEMRKPLFGMCPKEAHSVYQIKKRKPFMLI